MSLWDADQREWLQAMGYSLLVLADGDAVAEAATAPVADDDFRDDSRDHGHDRQARELRGSPAPAAGDPARTATPAAVPRRAPVPPAAVEAAAQPPAAPSRPRTDAAAKAAALEAARAGGAAARFDGPLWEALLVATGQSPAIAARTLREFGVDLSALRTDPAAKRALWPHLRRLRRGVAG